MPVNYVDSHCHLDLIDLSAFDDQMEQLIKSANEYGVSDLLNISVDLESFPRILKVARDFPNVYASVGLHPCHSPEKRISADELIHLSNDSNVVAIGETGLDYYMNNGIDPLGENFVWQGERFRTHIRAAITAQKPLIIHTREARKDVLDILKEENAERVGGVMHCFVKIVSCY